MVQATLDPATLFDRSAELFAEARVLRAAAAEQKAEAQHCRTRVGSRRRRTVLAIWRSRQLRYDKHGPIVAMWSGYDPLSQTGSLDLERLEKAVNRVFRVGLSLSSLAKSLEGADRERVRRAIAEMDAVIRELRQVAFDHQLQSKLGPSTMQWLARIREATAGIDDLLDAEGAASTIAFDLHQASQAAHRANISLGTQLDS